LLATVSTKATESFVPSEACPEPCRRAEGRTRWDRRLARYHRLAERAKEAAETGFLRKANLRYERDRALIKARFGSWEEALETEQGRTLGEAALARVSQAEELYYNRHTAPLLRAATVLAATQSPDLAAVLCKARIMQAHELQEHGALPKPALDLLAHDLGLLIRDRCDHRYAPDTAHRDVRQATKRPCHPRDTAGYHFP
jgi:hypothetical protein